MKLNITVDIDWIDEDYTLDDTIKQEVIDKLVEITKRGMKDNIARVAKQRISTVVDQWILDQLHQFCDRNIEITDKWGDTQEHHESVTEMFKAKFDEFFNATVDKNGKTLKNCSYGNDRHTRIDHMLTEKAEEYMSKITKDMDYRIKNAVSKAKIAEIEATIKKHVIQQVTDLVEK